MSGVEIVGILLGGFPLLISAAEHYKEGFEPLARWKRFRKEFIGFIDAIDIEKQLFYQMLERFLISADVPHEELCLFMTDPKYSGWYGKELVEKLKGRLSASFEAYMSTLQKMCELLIELQSLLCLKNGNIEWADEGASQWDYQLKRIRLSFSKRGLRILESFETHNRKLRELLDSSDKLESIKATRKDVSWGNVFDTIRKHAVNLHIALKRSWSCNCSRPHQGDLRLQCRNSNSDDSFAFNMAFDIPENTEPTIISRREVVIQLKKKINTPNSALSLSPSITSGFPTSSTDYLRPNFTHKTSLLFDIGSTPILAASATSVSPSSQSSFLDVFSRGSCSQATRASVSSICSTETASTTSNSWLSKSRKPKKTVRMQAPCAGPQIELTSNLQASTSSVSTIMTGHISADPTLTEPIDNLCSKIRTATDAVCMGHLLDDEQNSFDLTCLHQHKFASRADSLISLDSMLQGQGGSPLSRSQRYKIAYILASSVLQLQATPWLIESLDKRSIFFQRNGTEISLEHPYIQHSFGSVTAASIIPFPVGIPVASRLATRNSLSTLGILLLELCFGQIIEKQECRKPHLGPDGEPNSATDYMTARDWAEAVCEEDPAFENIIKCCVFCTFDEKADWASKKFTQAVYCNVVEPLEKISLRWV